MKKICSTYVFPTLFTTEECQSIKTYLSTLALTPATVTTTNAQRGTVDHRARKSNVAWFSNTPENRWIYDRIQSAFDEANAAIYGFSYTSLQEIQYIKYLPFHYFKPHFDCSTEVTAVRKLGISVQLSDPGDYWGGSMCVEAAEGTIYLPKTAGSAIVFPPYLKHQAKSVYLGSRHCLVTWVTSPSSFH